VADDVGALDVNGREIRSLPVVEIARDPLDGSRRAEDPSERPQADIRAIREKTRRIVEARTRGPDERRPLDRPIITSRRSDLGLAPAGRRVTTAPG
jgi:hypothetical protein